MLVFIDETGDHNLEHIDPQYPLFMLGALIISEEEYATLDIKVENLKANYFDDPTSFILHSSELKRSTNKKSDVRNAIMKDRDTRKSFYGELDEILKRSNFKLVTCLVKKSLFAVEIPYPIDPYYFCFENILNRIIRHGDSNNIIYAEMRVQPQDTLLRAEYERLCKVGIHKYSPQELTEKTSLHIVGKKENVNGLQMIDLILSCLARRALNKGEKMLDNDVCYDPVIKEKIVEKTFFPK